MTTNNHTPPIKITERKNCLISITELEKAFTEWDQRYRDNPEQFISEACHLLKENAKTYGEKCAPYFMSIINEIKQGII